MKAGDLARYRRHLARLEDIATELDDNVATTIRHLVKDDADGTEKAREELAVARVCLTTATARIEAALEALPSSTLRIVA